jgi:hypothetical protein
MEAIFDERENSGCLSPQLDLVDPLLRAEAGREVGPLFESSGSTDVGVAVKLREERVREARNDRDAIKKFVGSRGPAAAGYATRCDERRSWCPRREHARKRAKKDRRREKPSDDGHRQRDLRIRKRMPHEVNEQGGEASRHGLQGTEVPYPPSGHFQLLLDDETASQRRPHKGSED